MQSKIISVDELPVCGTVGCAGGGSMGAGGVLICVSTLAALLDKLGSEVVDAAVAVLLITPLAALATVPRMSSNLLVPLANAPML